MQIHMAWLVGNALCGSAGYCTADPRLVTCQDCGAALETGQALRTRNDGTYDVVSFPEMRTSFARIVS